MTNKCINSYLHTMGKNTDHTRNNINYDKKMSEISPISTKQTTASHQKSLRIHKTNMKFPTSGLFSRQFPVNMSVYLIRPMPLNLSVVRLRMCHHDELQKKLTVFFDNTLKSAKADKKPRILSYINTAQTRNIRKLSTEETGVLPNHNTK